MSIILKRRTASLKHNFFPNARDYLASLHYFDLIENTFMLSYCQKKIQFSKKKSFMVFQVFSEVAAQAEVILENILSLIMLSMFHDNLSLVQSYLLVTSVTFLSSDVIENILSLIMLSRFHDNLSFSPIFWLLQ